ncbi:MAG TPA: hypothetical protein VK590_13470, partial [Saprospiraceae bacterium]|nr:hypothetical protein [Saprospiraceae bacterium]
MFTIYGIIIYKLKKGYGFYTTPYNRSDNMMDNLFKELHGNNNERLIPVNTFNGRYELTLGLKSYKKELKILKEKVPHLIDHIYFIPNSFMQTFYFYKGNVWVDIYQLDWN